MFNKSALQLKRTEPVIGRFEYVVSAPDERQISFIVFRHHITGSVERPLNPVHGAVFKLIPSHYSGWPWIEEHAQLPFRGFAIIRIEDRSSISGQGFSHRSSSNRYTTREARY